MRTFFLLIAILLFDISAQARVLPIGSGGYGSLEAAAADAMPGDTILFLGGTHAGGAYVANLQGAPEAWITITGENGALISGGGNAFQLTDPAYLRITHLSFDGQTGNGLNIDDGGTYESPARHLLIEDCEWLGINATGNNDMLKMSGVDSFTVRGCRFTNGAAGGSMIDMVGCHFGLFERNRFENAGSNCIQAKGGTQYIRIERNEFYRGGQRAINIGGSTGLQFFRPLDAPFEASQILVSANIFTGAVAPIAYVGAVNCAVVQNTIFLPEKWALRILQESTDARFEPCGNNTFMNNIVVLDNRAAGPTINIGPDTAPETFQFRSNLWFNTENSSWSGPNTPTPDFGALIGFNPQLRAPVMVDGDFSLLAGSPAIGAGAPMAAPMTDFYGRLFNLPPSIGAIEGDTVTTEIKGIHAPENLHVDVFPQPVRDNAQILINGFDAGRLTITLFDAVGRPVEDWTQEADGPNVPARVALAPHRHRAGCYFLQVENGSQRHMQPILLLR